ncbi:MAG TPA: YjdF family protein [Candidatus Edwardsbacteria bacterium]|nr:YjdF family protein [Candidatus Edwardsbacteria bacterium]
MEVDTKVTVLFEEPFWIALVERRTEGRLEVARIIFGAEPSDREVHEHLLKNYRTLRFTRPVESHDMSSDHINPKRMQRIIRRELSAKGIGTKAQQALKLEQESRKQEKIVVTRAQRDAERIRKFQLKQAKRKDKHRGH